MRLQRSGGRQQRVDCRHSARPHSGHRGIGARARQTDRRLRKRYATTRPTSRRASFSAGPMSSSPAANPTA
jgi:hypothetical protein